MTELFGDINKSTNKIQSTQ